MEWLLYTTTLKDSIVGCVFLFRMGFGYFLVALVGSSPLGSKGLLLVGAFFLSISDFTAFARALDAA
jgi:F0F1-type ATP synthase assembly protein I